MGKRVRGIHLFYVVAALAALVPCGCLVAAAGAAGGAAVGATYYFGKVCQTFPTNLDDTAAGVKIALAELGMPLLDDHRESGSALFKSQTADGDPVLIYLDPLPSKFQADGTKTHVTVRVGVFGDHPASNRILDQITAHLQPAALVPPGPAPAAAPMNPIRPTASSAPPVVTPPPPPAGAFPPTTAPPPELPPS
jgi:Protein of unknown function (DUF3568)